MAYFCLSCLGKGRGREGCELVKKGILFPDGKRRIGEGLESYIPCLTGVQRAVGGLAEGIQR